MFEAQYLFWNATTATVFSPWFARQADNAKFTVDYIAKNSATFTVKVITKNSEDAGTPTSAVGTILNASSTTGLASLDVEGSLEELVRYEFTIGGDAGTDWVFFRMVAPVWYDDVIPAGA